MIIAVHMSQGFPVEPEPPAHVLPFHIAVNLGRHDRVLNRLGEPLAAHSSRPFTVQMSGETGRVFGIIIHHADAAVYFQQIFPYDWDYLASPIEG